MAMIRVWIAYSELYVLVWIWPPGVRIESDAMGTIMLACTQMDG